MSRIARRRGEAALAKTRPYPSSTSKRARGRGGVAYATGAIFPLCRRSIAHTGVHSGRMPNQVAGHGERARQFAHYPHSFRPEMAGAHRFRYHLSNDRCRTDCDRGTPRPQPCDGHRRRRKGEGTRGICVDATIQCEAAGTIRPRKARTEAATATQNREAARDAAFAPRREATAVCWFGNTIW